MLSAGSVRVTHSSNPYWCTLGYYCSTLLAPTTILFLQLRLHPSTVHTVVPSGATIVPYYCYFCTLPINQYSILPHPGTVCTCPLIMLMLSAGSVRVMSARLAKFAGASSIQLSTAKALQEEHDNTGRQKKAQAQADRTVWSTEDSKTKNQKNRLAF